MATPATGGSQSQDLGTVLRDWVKSHDGRLWQTREETSETIKKTGCGQTQVKNWFDYQRKQAKLALARALETPEVFLSEHDYEAAKTLKFAFAHAATTGYLAEPAKRLLAESTGLSDRAVIDLISKYHQKPEFAGIAAGIANVELRDPSTMADTTQRTDISISQRLPTSSVTGTRSAAPMQVSQSSRTSSPLQVECDAVTLSTPAPTDVASHATTKFSKKPNRIHTTLPDGRSLFGWHRGRQVNLTTEVVPLLSSFPGVESATCFSPAQRLIGFVTPAAISASRLLQQLQYQYQDNTCVLPDQVFALDEIPVREDGVVDFKALRIVAEQLCSPKSTAAGANGCHYCDASFSTAPLAADHLLYHTGPFHVCAVSRCPSNVAKARMTRPRIFYHRQGHEKNGDLKDLVGPYDYIPDAEEDWVRTPQEIRAYIEQLMEQEVDVGLVRNEAHRSLYAEESQEVRNEWFMALKQQAAHLGGGGYLRSTEISEKTQAHMLSYNCGQVKKGISNGARVAFKNLGNMCLGPRSSMVWITEICPRNARVDWTTAKVKFSVNQTGETMDFDIRCIECAKEYALSVQFRSNGILADDDDHETICGYRDCSNTRLYRSIYCSVHVLSQILAHTPKSKEEDRTLVAQRLQEKKRWELDPLSKFQLFLNRSRLPNAPRFFALDLEGTLCAKPPVVVQAAAVDIDAMDRDEFMFNVNIKRSPISATDINELTSVIDDVAILEDSAQDFGLNLLRFGRRVYWEYDQETLSGIRVDSAEAAEIIKASGIACHDYIVVWHKNPADVLALRYFLSKAGVERLLPPDDHIIRLPYLFRHNLQPPKGITCGLEFLFSIIFSEHPLCSTHHDALVDSRKLALMALLAESLCNGDRTVDNRLENSIFCLRG